MGEPFAKAEGHCKRIQTYDVMDAPNPSAIPTPVGHAPVHINAVDMMVRDLDRVTAYYRDVLGLTVQEHTREVAILGVGGVVHVAIVSALKGQAAGCRLGGPPLRSLCFGVSQIQAQRPRTS